MAVTIEPKHFGNMIFLVRTGVECNSLPEPVKFNIAMGGRVDVFGTLFYKGILIAIYYS